MGMLLVERNVQLKDALMMLPNHEEATALLNEAFAKLWINTTSLRGACFCDAAVPLSVLEIASTIQLPRNDVSGKDFTMRILYIDMDSTRPDHLGCYGYHHNTSPNIDALHAIFQMSLAKRAGWQPYARRDTIPRP